MSTFTLRLLGPFELAGEPTGAVRLGRKGKALVAIAAMQGTAGVTRSRLVELLWPDQAEDEARAALRQCLHLLRRATGSQEDLFDTEGDRIVLRAARCEVDALRFEHLARERATTSRLAAARLYGGEFLEGLDAGQDFSLWADLQRNRLRDIAHHLAAELSEAELAPAEFETAVRLARQLLAADPVHEGCWRALMRLHARAGLRAKALQAWDECRRVLMRELGAVPSAQTATLAEAVRNGEPAAAIATPAVTSPVLESGRDDDPVVVDLLLRGWQHYTLFTPHDNALARAAYEAALDRSPGNAEALSRLGWTHWIDSLCGWTADTALSFECAANCAARAIACGWTAYAAHTLQGKVLLWRMQFDAAVDQMQQAVRISPGQAYTHFNLGDALAWCGRCEEACEQIDRALALDPNDHGTFLTIRGLAHWMQGEHRLARDALDSARTRNPSYVWAWATLAAVHAECGEIELAREAAAKARQLNRRMSVDFAEKVLPFRVQAHRRRIVEAWRAAGMPRHEAEGGLPNALPRHPATLPV